MTCAPNGAKRAARARPIDPKPTTSTVWPSMSSIAPSSPGLRFHSARHWYSMNSGNRRCIARIEATTHSETGMSCTPNRPAHDDTRRHVGQQPVDACAQRLDDTKPGQLVEEAGQPVGDVEVEDDELDLGSRLGDELDAVRYR